MGVLLLMRVTISKTSSIVVSLAPQVQPRVNVAAVKSLKKRKRADNGGVHPVGWRIGLHRGLSACQGLDLNVPPEANRIP